MSIPAPISRAATADVTAHAGPSRRQSLPPSQAGPSRPPAESINGRSNGHHAPLQVLPGRTLFGPGWREIESFEDLDSEDEYSSDEEEYYAVLDMGQELDHRTMSKETSFQLIGLESATPFMKLGNQIYRGEITDPIGDEVILDRVRNPTNPAKPSHTPYVKVTHHISFRPVTLHPKADQSQSQSHSQSHTVAPAIPSAYSTELIDVENDDPHYMPVQDLVDASTMRSIVMQAPAPFGPNRGKSDVLSSTVRRDRDSTGRFAGSGPSRMPGTLDGSGGTGQGIERPMSENGQGEQDGAEEREDMPLRQVGEAESKGDMGAGTQGPTRLPESEIDAENIVPKIEPGTAPARPLDAPVPIRESPNTNIRPLPDIATGLTMVPGRIATPAASVSSTPLGSTVELPDDPDDLDNDTQRPHPRTRKAGRPRGSQNPRVSTRPLYTFENEDEAAVGLQGVDLTANPIVEIRAQRDPHDPSIVLAPYRLTKAQMENVRAGRPSRGKGSRSGKVPVQDQGVTTKVVAQGSLPGQRVRIRKDKSTTGDAALKDADGDVIMEAGEGVAEVEVDLEQQAAEEAGARVIVVGQYAGKGRRVKGDTTQVGGLLFTNVDKDYAESLPERKKR